MNTLPIKTFYRMEHVKGYGPFHGCIGVRLPVHLTKQWYTQTRNHANMEKILPGFHYSDHPHMVSGCISKEQLDTWFGGFYEILADLGYSVREYQSTEYIVVDDQAIFVKG